jgi:hypothetical protein
MYVNGNMRPVESMLGMGAGRIKEKYGESEFKYDTFDTL